MARFFGLGGRTRPDGVKLWPVDEIDPIEELALIIKEAQNRDDVDERRFADLAESKQPVPARARRKAPRSSIRRAQGF